MCVTAFIVCKPTRSSIYEAENRIVAEGSVVFDQGEDQRITGSSGEWNYRTKLGNLSIRPALPIKPTTAR